MTVLYKTCFSRAQVFYLRFPECNQVDILVVPLQQYIVYEFLVCLFVCFLLFLFSFLYCIRISGRVKQCVAFDADRW